MEVNFRLNLVSSWPRWITTASEVENELSSSALALLSFKILATSTSTPSAFLSAGPSNEILSSGKALHPHTPFFITDALTKRGQWQKKSWPLLNMQIVRRNVLWKNGKLVKMLTKRLKLHYFIFQLLSSLFYLFKKKKKHEVTWQVQRGMCCLNSHLKRGGLVFCLFFFFSLNYANALDVWSRLRHSVLLVVLLRYWVPLQWMHTTVHSTKSPPKGWKEFKAFKRQKGLSWDFFMYTEKKNKI